MERVEWLAKEMSKPGGTIESMLEFIEPKQSALRDKRFKSHVMAGLNTIDESVRLIFQVRQDFSSWKQVTTDLLRALEEKASSNKVQERETRSKLENQTFEKERLEVELEREKRLFDDFEKRFKKASQTYEGIINSLPATIAGSGAAIAAAAAVGLAPEALAVGIAFGGLNYAWIEYCQRVKMSTIKGLEKETSTLEDKLEQLSGQAKSIDEVARIVKETLKGLNHLQEQIDHFMEFLISIQKMILVVRDDKEDVLMEDLTLEDRKELKCDAKLKRGILSDALLMKNRFIVVSKATGLFNEVSECFVIPGVRWVTGLCLVEPAEEVVADKLKEIELWKAKTCKEAEDLIIKRVNELGIELEVLNRESMKSFGEAAPEILEKMMGEAEELGEYSLLN
ncbi:hypothetical protein BFJ63_vAg16007 [Fusarium oxysporum f. sp. narcissi]|uniref:Uncharacterized protein n=1 Tax=Fusarium oxysporum f. sp. narcissi TaxID=451672 RepID=A0A4Q2V2D7_FUSOX|nr:hypothetical protein BFJ63_vAg16007 [Fusarium oxysporum f. sp. narcissi]